MKNKKHTLLTIFLFSIVSSLIIGFISFFLRDSFLYLTYGNLLGGVLMLLINKYFLQKNQKISSETEVKIQAFLDNLEITIDEEKERIKDN